MADLDNADPHTVMDRPFAEWPSPLRAAYLDGWQREKLGTGPTIEEVMRREPGNRAAVMLGAAFEIGKIEALAQGRAS